LGGDFQGAYRFDVDLGRRKKVPPFITEAVAPSRKALSEHRTKVFLFLHSGGFYRCLRYTRVTIVNRRSGIEVVKALREGRSVGQVFRDAQAFGARLKRCGFRCHLASNMRAASDLSKLRPVDPVLRNTYLSDAGFSLLTTHSAAYALPLLPVENGCL
jgi:hypothetical protein